jgi:hypothetical protein
MQILGHHKNKHLETHLKVIATVALIVSYVHRGVNLVMVRLYLPRSSSEM